MRSEKTHSDRNDHPAGEARNLVPWRQIVATGIGGPDRLKTVARIGHEQLAEGDVRVRVLASGVSFADTMIRKGIYPGLKPRGPFVPGYELYGLIDEVGPRVEGFTAGDAVAALTVIGANAEHVTVPARCLVPAPAGLDPAEAVAALLSYASARQMLRKAEVAKGASILVHGAAGAVGSALVDLASRAGIAVFGTASAAKHEVVAKLGGEPIDYRSEDFVEAVRARWPGGVDAVFDAVGPDTLSRSFRCLRPGGKLISYGFMDAALGRHGRARVIGALAKFLPWNLGSRSATIWGIDPTRPQTLADVHASLQQLARRQISPVVGACYDLSLAERAHRAVERAKHVGKVVLISDGSATNGQKMPVAPGQCRLETIPAKRKSRLKRTLKGFLVDNVGIAIFTAAVPLVASHLGLPEQAMLAGLVAAGAFGIPALRRAAQVGG